jgi:catechol 2,3-dioxygenase-like lactoylglutathione lyase family enzyme
MELFLVTLLVTDYDDAIDYYCGVLGFALVEDTPLNSGKRWVVISPSGLDKSDLGKSGVAKNGAAPSGVQILLAKASTMEQREALAHRHEGQLGGRVGFFLHTTDFDDTYGRLKEQGVSFCETPRVEPYGKVVVFKDLYGNKWDLINRAA